MAIAQANKSKPVDKAYCVGAVLVDASGSVLATGYSRELPGNTHAEECCFIKMQTRWVTDKDSTSSTDSAVGSGSNTPITDAKENTGTQAPTSKVDLYTTMEPCSKRLSGKKSCTERLLELKSHIRRVIIGALEPPVFVKCTGADLLRDAGIEVVAMDDMKELCLAPNRHIPGVVGDSSDQTKSTQAKA